MKDQRHYSRKLLSFPHPNLGTASRSAFNVRLINQFWIGFVLCASFALFTGSAQAQSDSQAQSSAQRPADSDDLGPNQTLGFGNNKSITFTYLQNFDCVDQPILDLDFNHKKAQSDPNEMQIPICQPITEPTEDPTGGMIQNTAHLYVLVPMFSVDDDQNPNDAMACPNGGRAGELCGPALGAELIKLFGFVPEAWKKRVNSAITTQCPDPNHRVPGTCTMHASSVDLSKTLIALGKIPGPPKTNIFVPTPNHSHVVDDNFVNTGAIWWEVRPVLVLHQSDWPAADGSSGITSSEIMDKAEAAGRAIEVGSNFFLFFSSKLSPPDEHEH